MLTRVLCLLCGRCGSHRSGEPRGGHATGALDAHDAQREAGARAPVRAAAHVLVAGAVPPGPAAPVRRPPLQRPRAHAAAAASAVRPVQRRREARAAAVHVARQRQHAPSLYTIIQCPTLQWDTNENCKISFFPLK